MKLFDKILLGIAGVTAYGIAILIFSGELSSEYSREANSESASHTSRNISDLRESDREILLYDKEVDEIIEAYYTNIKANPEKWEEENRLIQENAESKVSSKNSESQRFEASKSVAKIQYTSYEITQGDSLWRISQKFNVPVYTIISANPDKEKEMIRPGDSLNIPNHEGILYTVRNGDSISFIAKKFKLAQSKIRMMNNINDNKLFPGQKIFLPDAKPLEDWKQLTKNRFIWPMSGKITSGYGMRQHPLNNTRHFHSGIDIGGRIGDKIKAVADGVVVFSGDGGTYGKMVLLRHKDGYLSIYAHASALNVFKDQFVKQGDVIARVGSTGLTTGPHLHFEVKKANTGINPISALKDKIKIKVPVNT